MKARASVFENNGGCDGSEGGEVGVWWEPVVGASADEGKRRATGRTCVSDTGSSIDSSRQ